MHPNPNVVIPYRAAHTNWKAEYEEALASLDELSRSLGRAISIARDQGRALDMLRRHIPLLAAGMFVAGLLVGWLL